MVRRSLVALVAFAFVLLGVPLGARSAAGAGTISLVAIGAAYTETFRSTAADGATTRRGSTRSS